MKPPLTSVTRAFWIAYATGLLLTAAGCGPNLPIVSGTVTLDGKPLADATVIFMPDVESQSPAQAITDAAGNFTLEQEAGESGVQPGEYSVRITTFRPAAPSADPPLVAVREQVPVRYNLETELRATVEPAGSSGENRFDFPLKSGGRIHRPAPDPF